MPATTAADEGSNPIQSKLTENSKNLQKLGHWDPNVVTFRIKNFWIRWQKHAEQLTARICWLFAQANKLKVKKCMDLNGVSLSKFKPLQFEVLNATVLIQPLI